MGLRPEKIRVNRRRRELPVDAQRRIAADASLYRLCIFCQTRTDNLPVHLEQFCPRWVDHEVRGPAQLLRSRGYADG